MARAPGLYRRGSIWWVKYYVNGRPVRESTHTEKETEAKKILDERRGRVATGQAILPRVDRIRYEEIAADLKRDYAATGRRNPREAGVRFAHLAPFFAGRRANTITPAVITEYVVRRQGEGAANASINRELATLSRMLRVAYRNGKLHRLPIITRLEEAAPRAGFFEPEQYQAVRKHLAPDLQAVTLIAYTYGWRIDSEVLPLERRQLDLKAGTLRLDAGDTKNDDGRVVYLTPELDVVLREQLERVEALQKRTGRIVPWLFPHLSGDKRLGNRREDIRTAWKVACKAAGVAGRIPHDFRRTAVRNLERAGVSRSVAMKITGHRTEAVYRRYAIVNDADLREAVTRLAGTITGTMPAGRQGMRPVTV
jgi:integrase